MECLAQVPKPPPDPPPAPLRKTQRRAGRGARRATTRPATRTALRSSARAAAARLNAPSAEGGRTGETRGRGCDGYRVRGWPVGAGVSVTGRGTLRQKAIDARALCRSVPGWCPVSAACRRDGLGRDTSACLRVPGRRDTGATWPIKLWFTNGLCTERRISSPRVESSSRPWAPGRRGHWVHPGGGFGRAWDPPSHSPEEKVRPPVDNREHLVLRGASDTTSMESP